ncbi:GrpB family protein [Halomontanus rarus]|uniref:GrpB family protein n=1 Tax=Halomontanus rarus TaxID=3034020 RepID=UPI0023E77A52|nr:GrpB family protein [Halovivax sp. TS33]
MDPDEDIALLEDPVWTEKYEREKQRLRSVAGEGLLGIHHVGSTAIPDVPGKPALDVLVAFDSFKQMDATGERIAEEHEEFERFSETDTSILLISWADNHAVFHRMHTMDDENKIRNQILFRDYLRDHAEARREYEEVKREAVENHADDPGDYTKAKSDVVADLIQRAEAAGYEERLPDYLQASRPSQ